MQSGVFFGSSTFDPAEFAETNRNDIGKFRPTVFRKAAFLGLRDGLVQDTSDPQFNQAAQTYSMGRFTPTILNRAAQLYLKPEWMDEENAPLQEQPDIYNIGVFHPTKPNKAAFLNLRDGLVQDTSDPQFNQAAQTYSIGCFIPTKFARAAYFSLAENVNDLYKPETNIEFIGKFKPTTINKVAFAALRQGANFDFQNEYGMVQRGQYRIQNNSATGYLIWIGVNTPPDFSQPADDFSATLPLVIAWPLPGTGQQNLYVVPRYRDSWGCVSQNSHPWIIALASAGPVLAPLEAPQDVFAYPTSNGNIAIRASYPMLFLDKDPADMVQVWVDVVSPDVTALPTYQTTINQSPFVIAFGNYVPGLYHVAIALYRSVDAEVSPAVFTTVEFPELPNTPEAVFTDNIS